MVLCVSRSKLFTGQVTKNTALALCSQSMYAVSLFWKAMSEKKKEKAGKV